MTKQEFKSIYDQYFDAIRNHIYYRSGDAEVASDVAQEVFLTLWKKADQINLDHVKSLLYKMAGDQFINQYRKSKTEENYLSTIQLETTNVADTHDIEFQELKKHYESALAELSEKNRTVFLMSRLEDLKYKEIADRLSISVKAVEKRMSTALAELKRKLNVTE